MHAVSGIEKELRAISHSQKKETQPDPALNQNEIDIQLKNMKSLAATFEQFTYREDTNFCNIIAGRLFEYIVKRDVLCINVKGIQLFKEFIDERLRKESAMSIWAPLKKGTLEKGMKTKIQRFIMSMTVNCIN